jgi:hypothetical protein
MDDKSCKIYSPKESLNPFRIDLVIESHECPPLLEIKGKMQSIL